MTSRREFLKTTGASATIGLTALAGCSGGSSDASYELKGGPETTSMTIDMTGQNTFKPIAAWVAKGATVTWQIGSGAHTATAYHPDNDKPLRVPEGTNAWDSGMLSSQGETFERTFDVEGVHDYYCIPHEAVGMVGTVVVGEPDLSNQPGMTEPQGDLPGQAAEEIQRLNDAVRRKLE